MSFTPHKEEAQPIGTDKVACATCLTSNVSQMKEAKFKVICSACQKETAFDQPYPYHAGFGGQGFLYDDTGTLTLTWDSYDKHYTALVGPLHPWAIKEEEKKRKLEDALLPAPTGGRWRFSNPARCPGCATKLSGPIDETIYYLVYPGSPKIQSLAEVLKEANQIITDNSVASPLRV